MEKVLIVVCMAGIFLAVLMLGLGPERVANGRWRWLIWPLIGVSFLTIALYTYIIVSLLGGSWN